MAPRLKGKRVAKPKTSTKIIRKNQGKGSLLKENRDINIENWIYRFLGNLAAMGSCKTQDENPEKSVRLRELRSHKKQKSGSKRLIRPPTPYSYDASCRPNSTAAVVGDFLNSSSRRDRINDISWPMYPNEMDDDAIGVGDNLAEGTNVSGNVVDDATAADAPSILQRVNRYISAGIEEGKRRARSYMRKAISFGLEAGYLTQSEEDCRLLRVSSALIEKDAPITLPTVNEVVRASEPTTKKTRKNANVTRANRRLLRNYAAQGVVPTPDSTPAAQPTTNGDDGKTNKKGIEGESNNNNNSGDIGNGTEDVKKSTEIKKRKSPIKSSARSSRASRKRQGSKLTKKTKKRKVAKRTAKLEDK